MSVYLRILQLRRIQQRRMKIQRRRLRDASDPFDIPDQEFISRYRLNHSLFMCLCDILHQELNMGITLQRFTKIPFEITMLAALSFLATGSYQRVLGNDYAICISQPSMSRRIKLVIEALNNLLNTYIKFPFTPNERSEKKQGFYRKFQFPGVIGCIDGTHVAIIAPRNHPSEAAFYCRKGYHSINTTIICDSDLKIIGVCAKFGGAAHDSHVWNSMSLRNYVEELYRSGEHGWLIGDSGYAQKPWLMTPILHAPDGSANAYYTKKHILVRNCVERCIGVLKNRWRCLLKHRVLHYDPDICGKIINACCILHNMCIEANIPEPEIEHEEDEDEENVFDGDDDEDQNERDKLVQLLWQNRRR